MNNMETLNDLLEAHVTHQNRISKIVESILVDCEKLRSLHQHVYQALVYSGYDTQATELVEEHNKVFARLFGTMESFGETIVDLGNDVQKIVDRQMEELEELKRMVRNHTEG